MFTGIIEAVGEVKKIIPLETGMRIGDYIRRAGFKRSLCW